RATTGPACTTAPDGGGVCARATRPRTSEERTAEIRGTARVDRRRPQFLDWRMMTTNPPSREAEPGAISASDRSPAPPESVVSTHLEPGFRLLELPGAPLVAFTTRHGGVSAGPFHSLNLGFSSGDRPEAVEENRRRLREALGLAEVASLSQVHGNDCL